MKQSVNEELGDPTGRVIQIVLAVGILALGLTLFTPFISPLLWSGVLCYALYPLYVRLVRITGDRRTLSALLMCLILIIGVIAPLVYMSLLIAEDLTVAYRALLAALRDGNQPLLESWRKYPFLAALADTLQNLERLTGSDLRTSIAENVAELGKVLVGQVTRLVTDALYAFVQLGMILLCAFYFFRDGDALIDWLRSHSPLAPERQALLSRRLDEVVKGAVYGNTIIALMEGLIGGVAFWSVGLPSAGLWGAAMGILAYLPLVGAGLIWIPAAGYLFWQGAYLKTVVLVGVGVAMAVMDYLVRTILVGDRSHLHTVLVFFSVLGGLQFFGLIGIVAGPLVVAMGITLVEGYQTGRPSRTVSASKV
ncbi:MAG: AI-2E family transporter [Nitrospira sp.]|nr:MAG: AI-2E family transporter [Nitrospira sp.]